MYRHSRSRPARSLAVNRYHTREDTVDTLDPTFLRQVAGQGPGREGQPGQGAERRGHGHGGSIQTWLKGELAGGPAAAPVQLGRELSKEASDRLRALGYIE